MIDVYELGYRKMGRVDDLPLEQPRVYRTGGAFILLLRSRFGVRAADVTHCFGADENGAARTLGAVAECLGDDALETIDWQSALEEKALPLETREGDIWVCVDQCAAG
jgi:hypothetical protein